MMSNLAILVSVSAVSVGQFPSPQDENAALWQSLAAAGVPKEVVGAKLHKTYFARFRLVHPVGAALSLAQAVEPPELCKIVGRFAGLGAFFGDFAQLSRGRRASAEGAEAAPGHMRVMLQDAGVQSNPAWRFTLLCRAARCGKTGVCLLYTSPSPRDRG